MLGLMQEHPLLISDLIEFAARHHAKQEIVSRRVEGDLHRYTYRDAAVRSRRLARALDALGLAQGAPFFSRVGALRPDPCNDAPDLLPGHGVLGASRRVQARANDPMSVARLVLKHNSGRERTAGAATTHRTPSRAATAPPLGAAPKQSLRACCGGPQI